MALEKKGALLLTTNNAHTCSAAQSAVKKQERLKSSFLGLILALFRSFTTAYSRIDETLDVYNLSHTTKVRRPISMAKILKMDSHRPAALLTDVVTVRYFTTLGIQQTLGFTSLTFTVRTGQSGDRTR